MKQGLFLGTLYEINTPFLFAFIRNRDNKVLFTQYIDDPLTLGKVCPFEGYAVSSKTVSIETNDGTIVDATHQVKEVSSVPFSPSFIWNAAIEEIPYERNHLDFFYLQVVFRGKRIFTDELGIISLEAKPHLETKINRYVFYLFYPLSTQPLPEFNEFPFDSYSNLTQGMHAQRIDRILLRIPPFLMRVHPMDAKPYFECLHDRKGIPYSMIEWNKNELTLVEHVYYDLYFMIHDRIYNTTVATGKLIKPSDPNTCRWS